MHRYHHHQYENMVKIRENPGLQYSPGWSGVHTNDTDGDDDLRYKLVYGMGRNLGKGV